MNAVKRGEKPLAYNSRFGTFDPFAHHSGSFDQFTGNEVKFLHLQEPQAPLMLLRLNTLLG